MTFNLRRLTFAATVAMAIAGTAHTAHAQAFNATVYSNLTTAQSYYTPGGATTAAPVTATIADDCTLIGGSTGAITGFGFSIINANSTTLSARPILSFYAANGTSGGPGTLLFSYTYTPVTLAAGNYTVVNLSAGGATIFNSPTNTIWYGETFDNGGGSTATAAQLNSFGAVIFNPPSSGSSTNIFFQSTNTGSTVYNGSNPSGSMVNFGGSPVANFGFAITGLVAPEPSAAALLLPGAMLMVGGIVRRRRACA